MVWMVSGDIPKRVCFHEETDVSEYGYSTNRATNAQNNSRGIWLRRDGNFLWRFGRLYNRNSENAKILDIFWLVGTLRSRSEGGKTELWSPPRSYLCTWRYRIEFQKKKIRKNRNNSENKHGKVHNICSWPLNQPDVLAPWKRRI